MKNLLLGAGLALSLALSGAAMNAASATETPIPSQADSAPRRC